MQPVLIWLCGNILCHELVCFSQMGKMLRVNDYWSGSYALWTEMVSQQTYWILDWSGRCKCTQLLCTDCVHPVWWDLSWTAKTVGLKSAKRLFDMRRNNHMRKKNTFPWWLLFSLLLNCFKLYFSFGFIVILVPLCGNFVIAIGNFGVGQTLKWNLQMRIIKLLWFSNGAK